MTTLPGSTVLISGAARGIGAATARMLADKGARLILFDVDAQPLRELVAEIGDDRAVSISWSRTPASPRTVLCCKPIRKRSAR